MVLAAVNYIHALAMPVYVLYKIASVDADSGTAEVFRSLKV